MKLGNVEIYGYIYKIINQSNKKVYIGQSINKFNRRYPGGKWWEHTHNEHLKRSVQKYGVSNFEVIKCLDVAFSKYELDIKEKVYTNMYNSTHRDFGYNKRDGGNGELSETSSKKISIRMLGYDIEEHSQDIIDCYVKNRLSIPKISKKYNVNSAVITRVLKKNKVAIRSNSENNLGFDIECLKDEIVDMYVNKKMSINQIKDVVNIGNNSLSRNLKRWGIEIRTISESIQAKPKGEDCRIWNSNDVYVYNKMGEVINVFTSNSKCAEWMVKNGISKTINSARDGIYQSVKKNRYYKEYKFEYGKKNTMFNNTI